MSASFYTHFGMLAAAFAHVEADLRALVTGVAFPENRIAAAAFLDSSQFSSNLRIFRDLGRQYPECEEQFQEIARRGNKLRLIRNLFIHGLWSPKTYGAPNGVAVVRTLKTTYAEVKSVRKWQHGGAQEFSVNDFANLLSDVKAVSDRIERLCSWLEQHEDLEFEYGGATIQGQASYFSIGPDGQLHAKP